MIKKSFLFSCFLVFGVISTAFCLEYQGVTLTPQQLNNIPKERLRELPPGTTTLQNIPPDVLKQLPADAVEKITRESKGGQAAEPVEKKSVENPMEPTDQTDSLIDNSEINSLEGLTGEMDEVQQGENTESKEENEKKVFQKLEAREASVIEEQYRKGYSSLLAADIQQFGYDIFRSASVKPSSLALPDNNYILGTGDRLLIRVWGSSLDNEYQVTVDREGIISIPKIGPVFVSGVAYGQVESIVRKEAEKYIQGINISITLTWLRSLEIYVVGEVKNPGLHMVPAFSTIFDGLIYAGGVKKTGTLRRIKLYRDDKTIQSFDLYDLLLQGNRKSDRILQNKDVIFVDDIGKTAAIAGAVNNPAIFEITGKKSLRQFVDLAGGLLPQAFGDRIFLKSFDKNRLFVVQDINFAKEPAAWNRIKVKNGDLLEIDFMGSSQPYVVRLSGNVWKPDMFQYHAGMKLSDILESPDLLMPDTLTEFALLFRYNQKTTRTTPMRFPLSDVFSGAYDAPLDPYDKIVILSRAKIGIQENFTIKGAVWNPGKYKFDPGLKLKDALALAGGIKDGARTDKIEVTRQIKAKDKFETKYITLNLDTDKEFIIESSDTVNIPQRQDYVVTLQGHIWNPRTKKYHQGMKLSDILISENIPKPEDILKPGAVMEFGLIYRYNSKTTRTRAERFPLVKVFEGTYDMPLQPFDKIVVLSRKEFGMNEKIHIAGAVWKSGEYDYYPGLRLKDAFAIAGGFKFGARKDNIELTRQVVDNNRVKTQFLLLDSDKDADFVLQAYDSILLPTMKNASIVKTISITGEVQYPGSYTLRENENLSGLIVRAGGFTENAYLYGAKYTSEKARQIQQQSIDKMVEKLELTAWQISSEKAQTENQQAVETAQESTKRMLSRLKTIKAEGRVAIKLSTLDSFKDSKFDFMLKDGDTLDIPTKSSFVSVVGSVYSPGSFLFQPDQKIEYYLEKSGGPSATSDEKHMYLLKANGEIISAAHRKGIFTTLYHTDIQAGDTIVVPEDLDRVPYLKRIKDITDIIFKIATTAGVALALTL